MARGQESKSIIANKILQNFEGSFLYNGGKEIRIPIYENGELIQIKVTLTAAKENVEIGSDSALPTAKAVQPTQPAVVDLPWEERVPTEQEKQSVVNVLNKLSNMGL